MKINNIKTFHGDDFECNEKDQVQVFLAPIVQQENLKHIKTYEYLLEFTNDASLEREDLQRALGAFRNALPSHERGDEEFIVEGIAFTGGFWTAFAYLQTRLEWNEVADLQIGEAGNTLSWRSISAKEMREIHYPNRLLHPSQVSRGRPPKPETPRPTRPSRGLLDLNTEGR